MLITLSPIAAVLTFKDTQQVCPIFYAIKETFPPLWDHKATIVPLQNHQTVNSIEDLKNIFWTPSTR